MRHDEIALYFDRTDAGRRLATYLEPLRASHPLVLGIPRGGVPVAAEVARALHAELDVCVARKLGAPQSKELAIGAVTADGARLLNEDLMAALEVSEGYLAAETTRQLEEAQRRERWFRSGRPAHSVAGRTVVLVDDGLATGATVRAAVRSLRSRGAGRVIVAVPVGAPQACALLAREADEVICPRQPEPFGAVGAHYVHFEPVEDAEVLALLGGASSTA